MCLRTYIIDRQRFEFSECFLAQSVYYYCVIFSLSFSIIVYVILLCFNYIIHKFIVILCKQSFCDVLLNTIATIARW